MSLDKSLYSLETAGCPLRVGMVGAGASGRAIAIQLATPTPGIRLVAIANRTLERAKCTFLAAGISEWRSVETSRQAEAAIAESKPVVTEEPSVLAQCDAIDVLIEVTGTLDHGARVVLEAIKHGKHVILVNAELDSLLGPILKAKADEAGVVLTHTDGEEPGVAMTLLRYLRSLGFRPVAAGNIKGMVDHYRTPETQREFAEKYGLDAKKTTSFADATKLSMETTILANATGFLVGRRGMYGPACEHVSEIAALLPAEQMLSTGLVDYALGAAPHTGAFVIVHEDSPLKKAQLAYYKLGTGPFYVFYMPFHLPYAQIASSIGRAVLDRDATVAPLGGAVCEVGTMAKRDLRTGETLDGIGGFCTYGLIENAVAARSANALPIGLSEGRKLLRNISRDELITLNDVEPGRDGLADQLWREQCARWPLVPQPAHLANEDVVTQLAYGNSRTSRHCFGLSRNANSQHT